MPRVTIQDLADKLGLSKFSVSRALSGKGGVSEATRHRVLRTAHAMGYRIGQESVRATGQILFLRQEIDPATSEVWLSVLHGAEREGERLGYAIVPRQARGLAETPPDTGSVGIILAMPHPGEIADLALRAGLPVAAAGYIRPFDGIDQIVGADWEAGVAVARLLTGLGHREMAFVREEGRAAGRAERFRGFTDGAAPVSGARVSDIVVDAGAGGFRAAFLEHLRLGAPTALFCADDGIAVTVVSELSRMGIRVPEDISVVGFNDLAAASQVAPRLTTVRAPLVEIGAMAVRCIADRLTAPARGRPPLRIGLIGELVERESTAPAAPARTWAATLGRPAREPV